MTFVTTGLLIAGITAMAVPILIHLLSRQRRRPIEWAAMRFLLEALRKHRRRLQLEQLLLLATRCLILLLLGAALARPFLEAAGLLEGGGSRTVFLVIDDGLASATQRPGTDTTALDESVETAQKLLASLGPGDTVGLITASRPARGLVVPPSTDHAAIAELLEALEPNEAPTDLPGALPILRGALEEMGPEADRAVVYLISEFRAGSAPLDIALPVVRLGDIASPTLLAAPSASDRVPNVQVTAVEPLRGLVLPTDEGGTGQVTVTLARSGGELPRQVSRVRLTSEGLPPMEPRVVQWAPGQLDASVDFVVRLAGRGGVDGGSGGHAIALTAVIEDDALTADNQRHTVVLTRDRVRTLLVYRLPFGVDPDLDRLRAGQWIHRALQPSDRSPMDVVEVDPAALDAVDLRGSDAAIITRPDLVPKAGWSALRDFVVRGGVLMVTPPGDANVHPWTKEFVETLDLPWRIELETIEPDEPMRLAGEQPPTELLRLIDAELPELVQPIVVNEMLPVDLDQTQADVVLAMRDGAPLVISGSPRTVAGNGNDNEEAIPQPAGLVIYLAVSPDLEWTSLPAKALMVPLVHELVKQGIGTVNAAQRFAVGERPALGLGAVAAALTDPRGARISIDAFGRPDEPLARSGLYRVVDAAQQRIDTLAVNIDATAGRTDPQDQAAVTEWLQRSGAWETFKADDPGVALRSADSGAPLAGMLLAIVLGLVVLETALARWFSHALPRSGTGDGGLDFAEAALASPGATMR